VATEVGEALPHWEMAVYLLDPGKMARAAETVKLTLGLLIAVLLVAIAIGGWLIVTDLNRQLALARQKTDFVSNVSHELKTPLTSIRMFSELLAEGRVAEPEKRQSYLNIISADASRLTRLINNVLDFSRMERGEKKYHFEKSDVVALARETVDAYRPHLESNGFRVDARWPEAEININGDRDALAQVVVNLLSNAEKYSSGQKEIAMEIEPKREPLPHVEVRIMDRGRGVPCGCEEKIFEQFYRAHDSLSSGIQGSGLGLTLARQIARAHGGDVVYQAREGGGSCFTLRLPVTG
jgi:signal transduction histidine kinase